MEPPAWRTFRYGVLVPQSDADGNDLGGVRLPELQVPLATYTGWNLRDPSIGAPEQRVSFLGSWIPLAKTAEERKKSGDPRLSIAERYASQRGIHEQVRAGGEEADRAAVPAAGRSASDPGARQVGVEDDCGRVVYARNTCGLPGRPAYPIL